MTAVQIEWVLFADTGEDVLANRLKANIPPVFVLTFLLTPFKSEMRPMKGFRLFIDIEEEEQIKPILNGIEAARRLMQQEGHKLLVQGIKILLPCQDFPIERLEQNGYKNVAPFQNSYIKYEKYVNVGISHLNSSCVQIQIRPKAPGLSIMTSPHHSVGGMKNDQRNHRCLAHAED